MSLTSRVNRSVASDRVDARPFKSLPANVGHETDPFGVLLADLTARAQEALVLSATGRDLDSDLTVSSGHAHDDGDSRILWHLLLSHDFVEDADGGLTANREGAVVTATSAEQLAVLPCSIPLAGPLLPVYQRLVLRCQVSNPSPGSVAYTTLYLQVTFYKTDFSDTLGTFQLSAQSNATHSLSLEWIEKEIYLSASGIDDAGGQMLLLIEGWVETGGDKATLWNLEVVAI